VELVAEHPVSPLAEVPTLVVRHFPTLAHHGRQRPAVHELVRSQLTEVATSAVWRGVASLDIADAPPGHELADLRPTRVAEGYRFTMACSIADHSVVIDYRDAAEGMRPEQQPPPDLVFTDPPPPSTDAVQEET
jgi:hypothetical protein